MSLTPLSSSPRLEALLDRLRGALVRQIWLHGLGSLLVVTSLWLLFMYGADRWLHLPRALRLFHGALLVGLPLWIARRHIVKPLGYIPLRSGLARLLERAHPGSDDLLVSAIELAPMESDAPGRELVDRVHKDAEGLARSLSPDPVLERSGPRWRFFTGIALAGSCTAILAANPVLAGIFFERALGGDLPWPQRTHLVLEIPAVGQRLQVESEGERVLVRAARGSDVPILVRAIGETPDEVILHFDSGHQKALGSGGTDLFRTLLRSVQQDVSFYVTGGDHTDEGTSVRLSVLQPPVVAGIAWEVTPPAYSGLAKGTVFDPDVEVLQGSTVRVTIQPDPADATGSVRLLPEDRVLPLIAGVFPQRAQGPEQPPSEEGQPAGLSFELLAQLSLRVSFDLLDGSGLPNPDPGLHALTVVEDRRPEVFLLAPSHAEVDVVAGGAVPLHVRLEDDFAIADVRWDLRNAVDPDEALSEGILTSRPVPRDLSSLGSASRDRQVARTRLEVNELCPEDVAAAGSRWTLQVVARDNREPLPGSSQSAPVHLRVVTGDEYLRSVKDQLARAGERAGTVYEQGRSQLTFLQSVLASLEQITGDTSPPDGQPDFSSLLHSAKRLEGDARALARDLAQVTEGLLYARIDERAAPLLDGLDQRLAEQTERGFPTQAWAELHAAHKAGELGQAQLAGDLLEMVGLALEVSEEHGAQAVSHLQGARDEPKPAQVLGHVEAALLAQVEVQASLDRLLAKLGEWDNFQSVLTLTRDILNHQKSLKQRTQRFAEDK